MNIKLEFKKQDAWIGAYWDKDDIWICLIPCFPIHISKRYLPNTCDDCGFWHPNEPCKVTKEGAS